MIGDLNQYYLYPIDEEKLLRGAINGAMGSLNDEFTYYSQPEDNAIDQENLGGNFYGIGVQLIAANADGTGGKIDNVFKTGAAIGAGVQIGDVFVKVATRKCMTSKLDEIVRLVRGKQGHHRHRDLCPQRQALHREDGAPAGRSSWRRRRPSCRATSATSP